MRCLFTLPNNCQQQYLEICDEKSIYVTIYILYDRTGWEQSNVKKLVKKEQRNIRAFEMAIRMYSTRCQAKSHIFAFCLSIY